VAVAVVVALVVLDGVPCSIKGGDEKKGGEKEKRGDEIKRGDEKKRTTKVGERGIKL